MTVGFTLGILLHFDQLIPSKCISLFWAQDAEFGRKHCKKVFDTFLNSAFSFLFISVIVLILLGAIQSTVSGGTENVTGCDKMFIRGDFQGEIAFMVFAESVSWGSGFAGYYPSLPYSGKFTKRYSQSQVLHVSNHLRGHLAPLCS